jgi:hypothetical protein
MLSIDPRGGQVRRSSAGPKGQHVSSSWQDAASSDDEDVKFIAAVTPRGGAHRTPTRQQQQTQQHRPQLLGSAARVRPTSGIGSAHRLRATVTPPHLVSSSSIDTAAPKLFTVFCAPSAGTLFTEMLALLLKRDGHRWLPVTLPEEGRRPSAKGRADAGATVCCNRLAGVNLFLGEKLAAEKLIEEARVVGLRVTRGQPEAFSFCPHEKWRQKHHVEGLAPLCLVNYYAGLRSITLKSKMVKTLLAYHRGSWKELGKYLPRTHTMVPRGGTRLDEREELVSAMCADNVDEFNRYKVEAGYWIAKPSHGAHGSDIKIFFANQQGLDDLVTFMDSQEEPYQWVVSKYISRPLLYKGRKFDLRCWVLVDTHYHIYLHDELVMRTSSEVYDARNITTDSVAGRLANITNHCVQAEGDKYSLHEEGNELWKDTLSRLVQETSRAIAGSGDGKGGQTLSNHVIPQIESIVVNSLLAAAATMGSLSNPGDLTRSFQVLGYDFILDEKLNVWLLEINGAPGVAQRLLKQIVHDVVELVVDPVFASHSGSPLRLRKLSGLAMNGFTKIHPKE